MHEVMSKTSRNIVIRFLQIAVLFFVFGLGAYSSALEMNGEPAAAMAVNVVAPQGVKVLAQVPLQGPPATRMYTQWECGSTYVYIEQGENQTVAVDITNKQRIRIVDHQPGVPIAPQREQADGGPIEIPSHSGVVSGVDNVRDLGTLSVLQPGDPADAQLLRFFGQGSSNLVDRDQHLIFFASPTRLLILQDQRWFGVDYNTN